MPTLKSRAPLRNTSPNDRVIDAVITNVEVMSAREFLKIMKERPQDIESSVFCPPSMSNDSFGSFKVKFVRPRLVAG